MPEDRKRVRLSTTIAPETMGRLMAAAAKRGIGLGEVVDELVRRNPAYLRGAG